MSSLSATTSAALTLLLSACGGSDHEEEPTQAATLATPSDATPRAASPQAARPLPEIAAQAELAPLPESSAAIEDPGAAPLLADGISEGVLEPDASSDSEPLGPFPAQPGWVTEEVENAMRIAQFRLPKETGDAEDAALVVFAFGGQAGSVESNLGRWTQMVAQPDGRDSNLVAQRITQERDGVKFHTVDVGGTLKASTMPGQGGAEEKTGWRLIGTVIEQGGKSYYVKLTGPQRTVEHWKASYLTFLDQVQLPQ